MTANSGNNNILSEIFIPLPIVVIIYCRNLVSKLVALMICKHDKMTGFPSTVRKLVVVLLVLSLLPKSKLQMVNIRG